MKKYNFSCCNDLPCTYLQCMLYLIQLAKLKKLDFRKNLNPLCNFIQHGLARSMMICCPDISPYNHSGFFLRNFIQPFIYYSKEMMFSIENLAVTWITFFSSLLVIETQLILFTFSSVYFAKKGTKDEFKSSRIIL